MSLNRVINFRLNGRPVSVTVPVTMKTLNMLRDVLDLTGTKYACGEGECGACTIRLDGKTINSCLMYAVDCDGRDLVTIEGLKTEAGSYSDFSSSCLDSSSELPSDFSSEDSAGSSAGADAATACAATFSGLAAYRPMWRA